MTEYFRVDLTANISEHFNGTTGKDTGNFVPSSLRLLTITVKMHGSTVYRPYPRRLDYLTKLLQRQHILLSVGPGGLGLEPETSRTAVQRSTN